jgi:hypothetical protein
MNLSKLVMPTHTPPMADFMAGIPPVYEVADASPGFVWRWIDKSGSPWAYRPYERDVIANLSVWESPEAVKGFVYSSLHRQYYERRFEWFVKIPWPRAVFWWIPVDTRPTYEEAKRRLDHLAEHGSTVFAWDLGEVCVPEPSDLPLA